jgi:hypothetical protein
MVFERRRGLMAARKPKLETHIQCAIHLLKVIHEINQELKNAPDHNGWWVLKKGTASASLGSGGCCVVKWSPENYLHNVEIGNLVVSSKSFFDFHKDHRNKVCGFRMDGLNLVFETEVPGLELTIYSILSENERNIIDPATPVLTKMWQTSKSHICIFPDDMWETIKKVRGPITVWVTEESGAVLWRPSKYATVLRATPKHFIGFKGKKCMRTLSSAEVNDKMHIIQLVSDDQKGMKFKTYIPVVPY